MLEESLTADLVQVYRAALDPQPSRLKGLYELLAPEERDRAERFHFPIHRQHFVACRGLLREILAAYLRIEPALVHFSYNQYGKPALPHPALRFNVSHSGGWALFAVTQDREVGVDIEEIRARDAQADIADRYFSPGEAARLRELPEEQRTEAFFRCWTRKEAYIKARGMGLSLALDSFDVSFEPGEPAVFLRGAGNYTLREIPAPPGFAAAVAAEGSDWIVRWRDLIV